MLPYPHEILSFTVATSIDPSTRTIQLESSNGERSELEYERLVLAMGTKLSPPGTIPGNGTKREGIEYLRGLQERSRRAKRVVIFGGGAIGVRELLFLLDFSHF